MRTAKYCLIKQMNWSEYTNQHNTLGIVTGYNIYVDSFQDACSYITQDILNYYLSHCKDIFPKYRREDKLREYAKYILLPGGYKKPKNLRAFKYIYAAYEDYYLNINGDIEDVDFLPEDNLLLLNFISRIIVKIINGEKVDYFYFFPIQKVEIDIKVWNRHYRPHFHNRDDPCNRLLKISKAEKVAGTDPEYSQYLSARQINREKTQNYGKWKKNRFQIPGDWKHYHKCRKQWAKNIDNPSYEKLSKAVWKQELKEIESEINCT